MSFDACCEEIYVGRPCLIHSGLLPKRLPLVCPCGRFRIPLIFLRKLTFVITSGFQIIDTTFRGAGGVSNIRSADSSRLVDRSCDVSRWIV